MAQQMLRLLCSDSSHSPFLMEMAAVVSLNNSDGRRTRALWHGVRVKVEGWVVCLVWVDL